MSVWSWLQQNATALTGLGNLLFVIIWIFYLQMFYQQYRRQQRAKLVIHHAQGSDPSASCMLVNMSKEPIHVQCVMACVETEGKSRTHQVTDYRRMSADDGKALQLLRQGPLASGDYLLLGRFEDIIRGHESSQEQQVGDDELPLALEEIRSVELRAVAIHGPSDHAVGARRRFFVEQHDDQMRIHPERLQTKQLTSWRGRRQAREWLRDHFAQVDAGGGDCRERSRHEPVAAS